MPHDVLMPASTVRKLVLAAIEEGGAGPRLSAAIAEAEMFARRQGVLALRSPHGVKAERPPFFRLRVVEDIPDELPQVLVLSGAAVIGQLAATGASYEGNVHGIGKLTVSVDVGAAQIESRP